MTMETNNIFDGQMSGWQTYSTDGPDAMLDQPFIQDVALILEQMREKGTLSKFFSAVQALNLHISKEEIPHNFNVSQFAAELLHDLYLRYREQGYLTDQEEMYRRLFFDQQVASWAELYHGANQTKAVDAVKFKWLFDQHNADVNSHSGIFAQFLPQYVNPYDPTIYLSHVFNRTSVMQDWLDSAGLVQYTLNEKNWCKTTGTLVLALNFIVPSDTPTKLLSIFNSVGYGQTIYLQITPEGKLELCYTYLGVSKLICSQDLMVDSGEMALTIVYQPTSVQLCLASDLSAPVVENPLPKWDFNTLQLHVPMEDDRVITSIPMLNYFPQALADPLSVSSELA